MATNDMCGLLAAYSERGVDHKLLSQALKGLEHRGPDALRHQVLDGGRLFLGHARLKIIDLSDDANQPMVSPDGRYVLVLNGEIYNYQEIRDRIGDRWSWRTRSDTEVLLALLSQQGIAGLSQCVGMFAFVFFDTYRRRLTLVRDRFGIKPLYVSRLDDGGFALSSEIPPLLSLRKSVRADEDVVFTYLESALYETGRRTFFAGIESVGPGAALQFDLRTGKSWETQWYELYAHVPDLSKATEIELIDAGMQLAKSAVRDHLVADVRAGLNVSGGVDSSVLVSLARSFDAEIHLFSQDYEPPYGEEKWVKRIAGHSPLHITKLTEQDIAKVLEQTVRLQAEPFGGVTVAGYHYLYQDAENEGVTVLLDGNGVDEVFLGYKKYHAAAVQFAKNEKQWREMGRAYSNFWGAEPPPLGAADARTQSIDGSFGARGEAISQRLRQNATFLAPPDLSTRFSDPIRAMAVADLVSTKIPRSLRFNDRMSMAWSKELRVPFLDHRLVEFGLAVPRRFLLNRHGSKALFRKMAMRLIPENVAAASKRSVQSPQREWLAGPWRKLVENVLTSESFAGRGWIDTQVAKRLYSEYLNNTSNNSFFVWQWLNLEWWARAYLDGKADQCDLVTPVALKGI